VAGFNFKDECANVVLTEGKNDCHVILALCRRHDIPETFGFYACGSDDKVLKRLSALIAGSEPVNTIGVILDSDNPNLKARWRSLKQRLLKEGYRLPERPKSNGTIVSISGKPTVGIWLMPDNNMDGMLEDFCLDLVDENLIAFSSECVREAERRQMATFIDSHRFKAVIHTFLAWQNEPGMPLGQAITARALDGDKPLAKEFSAFLKRLF